MSYIFSPRLSFIGRFLSDVSTRNNIDSNYRPGTTVTDLWNASGGAAFELLDCRVVPDSGIPQPDPASRYVVTGAIDRTSGKMVDLDPDWQGSSELWGLTLRIIDPETDRLVLQGSFEVAAFRDLWTRQTGPVENGQPAGARYVSVLNDIEWGPAVDDSPRLLNLREVSQDGKLSVALHQFGYFYTEQNSRYRTGSVVVHIGPYFSGEPDTALVHRRIGGLLLQQQNGQPFTVISDIDFALSSDGKRGYFDIGQSLLINDVDGTLTDLTTFIPIFSQLRSISVGLLPESNPDIFSDVPASDVLTFLDLPSTPDWYKQTGGIISVDIPDSMADQVTGRRLALFGIFSDGRNLLFATETEEGIFCRTDTFVRRLDPPISTNIRFHARKFGVPLPGLKIHVSMVAPPGNPPGLTMDTHAVSDAKGLAEITMTSADPGNPRSVNDLDGQIFIATYSHKLNPQGLPDQNGTGLGRLDLIIIHVRDPFPVPDTPEFHTDIQPIMTQYAQLYPIMSKHLFDIADYDALVKNRRALLLAFSRSIYDPNYMPVTRDLSSGKMATLVKWLSQMTEDADLPLLRDPSLDTLRIADSAAQTGTTTLPQSVSEDAKSLLAKPLVEGLNIPVLKAEAIDKK